MRAVIAAVLIPAGLVLAAADPNEPVAVCGTDTFSRGQIDAVLTRLGMFYLPPGPRRQRAEAAVLEQLIDDRLLRIELNRAGIGVTAAEIDAGVERLRERLAGRGGDLAAMLAQTGRDERMIRDQVALELALDKFVAPQLTREAIEAAFESRRRELDGTQLRVSHLLLRPDGGGDEAIPAILARAAAIRREIVQGSLTFEEAARRHSSGPSRRQGGDLGFIGRDGPMVEDFNARAFALAKGDVSEPFASPFGVHVIKVTDVSAGRLGLDAVRPQVEKMLAASLVRQLVIAARGRNQVDLLPGAAHFDPASLGQPAASRRVLVAGEPAGE